MEQFYLMDGAMAYGVVSKSKPFADPNADWFTGLMPNNALRLAGPMLLSPALISAREPAVQQAVNRAIDGFPHRLHLTYIESDFSFAELAEHLRRFVYFGDSVGEPYGLRIADNRVLAYLYRLITLEQWHALSEPFATLRIHGRSGTVKRFTPSAQPAVPLPKVPWQFDDEQIRRLIDAGEPDALLSRLNLDVGTAPPAFAEKNYEVASQCVDLWRAGGSDNRGALLLFSRRVFASGGSLLADPAACKRILAEAAAAL